MKQKKIELIEIVFRPSLSTIVFVSSVSFFRIVVILPSHPDVDNNIYVDSYVDNNVYVVVQVQVQRNAAAVVLTPQMHP